MAEIRETAEGDGDMADVLAVRDEYRLQEWAQIHRRCRESGLSNREFCRQNGIAEKTFYYWLFLTTKLYRKC